MYVLNQCVGGQNSWLPKICFRLSSILHEQCIIKVKKTLVSWRIFKKNYPVFVDFFYFCYPDFGSFGRVMLIFIPHLMFLVDFWFILLEFGFFFFNFCDFLAILVG